jgi:hypothetical protein
LFDKLQFVGSNDKLKLVGQKHLFYWDRGRPARILITAARSASNQSPDEFSSRWPNDTLLGECVRQRAASTSAFL